MNRVECQDVMRFGQQLASSYSSARNVLFDFSDDYRVGEGGTRRFDTSSNRDNYLLSCSHSTGLSDNGFVVWNRCADGGCPEYIVSVGIGELSSDVRRLLLSRDCGMAAIVICMTHEMRHVEQYDVARGKIVRPHNMPPEAIWSLVVTCGNRDFRNANYKHLAHEIDAETVGVLDAAEILRELLGESRCTVAVSKALTRSGRLGIGPIDYGSVPSRFGEAWFAMCVSSAEQRCVLSRDTSCLFDSSRPDFASLYLSLNKTDCETFKTLVVGSEQDVYLAKINVKYNEKERHFFDRPSLSFPMGTPEPCGGMVNRGVAVQGCRLSRAASTIDVDLDTSYMYSNDEEMDL